MKKLIVTVALATTMGTASAGFFNNNNYNGYNQDNGLFAYNPYSFFDPRWFMQEAENFVDEFDNDDGDRYGYNGYNSSTHSFPVTSYNKNYVRGYARGYTARKEQMANN
jgi:hypothetical protein